MKPTSCVLAAVLAIAALAAAGAPASASGGGSTGGGPDYFLNDAYSGTANHVLTYGDTGDEVFVTDANGDGRDSLTIRRGNTFFVRNSLSTGVAERTFAYGNPGDVVLFGDWNGDGVDTPAVRRGNRYLLSNRATGGTAETSVTYGNPGDVVLVGDWNGDGKDSLTVRRGNEYFVRNALTTGPAERVVTFGNADDVVVVGRFGGGASTLGVRRGPVYFLQTTMDTGPADVVVGYGQATDATLVGDWNGDRTETLGVRRQPPVPVTAARASYASQLVDGVNAHRSVMRLGPLAPNACAQAAAQRWAEYLAASGARAHQDLGAVLRSCPGAGRAAENLAWTSGSAAQMVEMWMNSPGHRANILNGSLSAVGSAAVQGSNGQWVGVQVFLG